MSTLRSLSGLLVLAPLAVPAAGQAPPAGPGPIRLQDAGGTLHGTFGTIQEAVDAASEGDVVLIPAGVFSGPGNRDVLVSGKNLVLQGAGEGLTVVDCEGQARGFTFSGPAVDASTLLADLSIRNGSAHFGGGVMSDLQATPSFADLEISGCTAVAGGAMYASPDGAWNATELWLHDNFADSGGGAIQTQKCGGLISASRIEDNFSGTAGGGISLSNLPANDESSPLRIEDTIFLGNEAFGDGGGFYSEMTDLCFLDRCTFLGNRAGASGGGIRLTGDLIHPPAVDVVFLQNSLVADNEALNGGGIQSILGSMIVQNCTIADNRALGQTGGLSVVGDGLLLINTILWGNASADPDLLAQQVNASVSASLFFLFGNDVQGGVTSPTSISADPLFVSPATGDYRLGIGSPCINAGIGLGILAGQLDLDGRARVRSNAVDMGAYERVADVRPVLGVGAAR